MATGRVGSVLFDALDIWFLFLSDCETGISLKTHHYDHLISYQYKNPRFHL